jgi:hypothetical protein
VKRLRPFAPAGNAREPLFTETFSVNCESESDFLKRYFRFEEKAGSCLISVTCWSIPLPFQIIVVYLQRNQNNGIMLQALLNISSPTMRTLMC